MPKKPFTPEEVRPSKSQKTNPHSITQQHTHSQYDERDRPKRPHDTYVDEFKSASKRQRDNSPHKPKNADQQEHRNLSDKINVGFYLKENKVEELLGKIQKLSDTDEKLNKLQYALILLRNTRQISISPNDVLKIFTTFHQIAEREKEPSPKQLGRYISSALHCIGVIAKQVHSPQLVNTTLLAELLQLLLNYCKLDGLTISNSLYGIGLLAQSRKIAGEIDARGIQHLFNKLNDCDSVQAQNISNSLYGMGLLAQRNHINDKIDAYPIQNLLSKLHDCHNIGALAIRNSLYGIGLLAQAGNIEGKINASHIENLFKKLNKYHPIDAQEIANSLYGLGLLARAKNIEGKIDARVIQNLLVRLNDGAKISAQDIAQTFYSIGLLAQAGNIQNKIDTQFIENLLNQLNDCAYISAQDIAQTLYGIGLLAQTGNIVGKINNQSIQNLFEKLRASDNSQQDIGQSLYGIGLLVQADNIVGKIHIKSIQDLLGKLTHVINIAQALYGVAITQQTDVEYSFFQSLLGKTYIQKSHVSDIQQLAQAHCLLYPSKPLPLALKTELKKQTKTQSTPTQTRLLTFLNTYKSEGVEITSEALIGAWFVDVLIKVNGKFYVFEVDGPHHYTERGDLRLEDQQRDRWLEDQNYTVVRLRNSKFESFSDNELSSWIDRALKQNIKTKKAKTGPKQSLPLNQVISFPDSKDLPIPSIPKLSAQKIANKLYGLGTNNSSDLVNADFLTGLVNQLNGCSDINAEAIAKALYGIGLLAHADRILGTVDADVIQNVFSRLKGYAHLNAHQIINAFLGVAMLKELNRELDIDYSLSQSLFEKINLDSLANTEIAELAQAHALLYPSKPLFPALKETVEKKLSKKSTLSEDLFEGFLLEYQAQAAQENVTLKITSQKLIGAWFVDILIEVNGQSYVIMVEDITCSANHPHPILTKQRRNQWLNTQDYYVTSIKDSDLDSASDEVLFDMMNKFLKLNIHVPLPKTSSNTETNSPNKCLFFQPSIDSQLPSDPKPLTLANPETVPSPPTSFDNKEF